MIHNRAYYKGSTDRHLTTTTNSIIIQFFRDIFKQTRYLSSLDLSCLPIEIEDEKKVRKARRGIAELLSRKIDLPVIP